MPWLTPLGFCSSYLGQFWKAGAGNFSRAPKVIRRETKARSYNHCPGTNRVGTARGRRPALQASRPKIHGRQRTARGFRKNEKVLEQPQAKPKNPGRHLKGLT